jgi:hypothetical protein
LEVTGSKPPAATSGPIFARNTRNSPEGGSQTTQTHQPKTKDDQRKFTEVGAEFAESPAEFTAPDVEFSGPKPPFYWNKRRTSVKRRRTSVKKTANFREMTADFRGLMANFREKHRRWRAVGVSVLHVALAFKVRLLLASWVTDFFVVTFPGWRAGTAKSRRRRA